MPLVIVCSHVDVFQLQESGEINADAAEALCERRMAAAQINAGLRGSDKKRDPEVLTEEEQMQEEPTSTSTSFAALAGAPPRPVTTALIIDDTSTFRIMHRMLICKFGFQRGHITEVQDGEQGLHSLQDRYQPYDLVLCDLEMPNMDGMEMIRALRALETEQGRPHQKACCITAADHMTDEALLEAGFDRVARKPMNTQKMAALLDKVLGA